MGTAAVHGRFAHKDLSSILTAGGARTTTHAADETRSLTQGTAGWAAIGRPPGAGRGETGLEESA
ncbi:hypothetical protein H4V95_000334 [Arthrobacter sp. CAN_C5]|nr:hypothetical protein [Arthrobacter sp. CAN_C5]MBP2215143.1 hypothetical protein [Arthrobacter sp. CAN_C5]